MASIQDRLFQQLQDMDDTYEAYAKSKGLTYLSLMVLEEIYELGEGCNQKQISDDTHYPKQSINLVIKSFLNDGIVELSEMPENRKNKRITLTDKGKALCRDVVEPMLEQEKQLSAFFSEDEMRELLRLTERYGEEYCRRLRGLM